MATSNATAPGAVLAKIRVELVSILGHLEDARAVLETAVVAIEASELLGSEAYTLRVGLTFLGRASVALDDAVSTLPPENPSVEPLADGMGN